VFVRGSRFRGTKCDEPPRTTLGSQIGQIIDVIAEDKDSIPQSEGIHCDINDVPSQGSLSSAESPTVLPVQYMKVNCIDAFPVLIRKEERDFDSADDVNDELRDSYDVAIDDKLRQWSVGGRFNKSGQGPPDNPPFVRRGGGILSKADEATIVQLREERTAAKLEKYFGKADRICDRFGDEVLVCLDD
jgi:hypothetical protein